MKKFLLSFLIIILLGSPCFGNKLDDRQLKESYAKSADVTAQIDAAVASISTNSTIEVLAGDTLTAGDVCSLISEGGVIKAYHNPLTVNAAPNGVESVFNVAASTYISSVCLDTTRFLVTYADSDTYPKAIVGTVSGSTIAWGSESAAFENVAATYLSACKIATDKVLVCYRDGTNPLSRMVVLSISTTSITVGTPASFLNDGSTYISVSTLETDKALLTYFYGSSGQSKIITISSTTPTPYPAATSEGTSFNASATNYISVSALSSTSAIVAYQDGGNSNFGTAQILSISGTTITPGTEYVYKSETAYYIATLSLSSTSAIICDVSASGTRGKSYIATISNGIEIAYGAVTQLNVYASYLSIAKISSNRVMWIGGDVTNNYGQSCLLTITGTDITAGSFYAVNSAGTGSYYAACYLGNNKTIFAYKDEGNSNYGTAVVNTWSSTSYSGFRGIATSSVSSGAQVDVMLQGIMSGFGTLLQGSDYYLNSTTDLQTTPVSLTSSMATGGTGTGREICCGTAITSDKLLFKVNYK